MTDTLKGRFLFIVSMFFLFLIVVPIGVFAFCCAFIPIHDTHKDSLVLKALGKLMIALVWFFLQCGTLVNALLGEKSYQNWKTLTWRTF